MTQQQLGVLPPTVWDNDHWAIFNYIGNVLTDPDFTPPDFEFAKVKGMGEVDGHTGWDCVQDFQHFGLIQSAEGFCTLTTLGWTVFDDLAIYRDSGGEIRDFTWSPEQYKN